MAKRSTPIEKAISRAKADASGGINAEETTKLFSVLTGQHKKKLTRHAEYMNDCRAIAQVTKDAVKHAKSVGVPVAATKAAFQIWLTKVSEENIRAGLEPDDATLLAEVEKIIAGKGTPLGDIMLGDKKKADDDPQGLKHLEGMATH